MSRRTAVAAAMLLVAGACGGGGGAPARSASSVLDDLAKVFPRSSIDDVTRGSVDDLDDIVRRNGKAFDDAFRTPAFATEVATNQDVAGAELWSRVQEWFGRFDEFVQRRIELRLRAMVCEARLYAYAQPTDPALIGQWIMDELAFELPLDAIPVPWIRDWIVEKMHDPGLGYTFACMGWSRATTR